jgi:hypothetical protein
LKPVFRKCTAGGAQSSILILLESLFFSKKSSIYIPCNWALRNYKPSTVKTTNKMANEVTIVSMDDAPEDFSVILEVFEVW